MMNSTLRTNDCSANPGTPPNVGNLSLDSGTKPFHEDLLALLPRLHRFARSLTGSWDQADDLLQACCERALSRQHQWQPGTRLDSWVFTIMRSIRYNQQSALSRTKVCESLELGAEIADERNRTPEREVLRDEVIELVSTLPELQRAAIILVYVEGYKYQEASELLGIPLGTLMSRLARAKAQIGKWVIQRPHPD